ncbi:hypothetical protein FH972_010153 [Carpinus fangiana]|uniref:Uncharacterized protein n=1 Tax=Carpinus fangiana TaxID=176857 RepID=A0A660KP20_9ROSI|nr:hypothetical protein FH972_010153 [Carpinus fangiana]
MVKISSYTEEIAEAARLQHIEFRENHLKWLEDGNLHSAVFSPATNPQVTAGDDSKSSLEAKPKYRGKYV